MILTLRVDLENGEWYISGSVTALQMYDFRLIQNFDGLEYSFRYSEILEFQPFGEKVQRGENFLDYLRGHVSECTSGMEAAAISETLSKFSLH